MKTLIKNVLDDMSGGQLNFESDAAREMIANTIMAVIKTDGDWFLDLSTLDGGPKLDMPIYEKTKEQKARDSWVCSICGENTADVDYDYIGSGTNHLGCELEIDMKSSGDEVAKALGHMDESGSYYIGPDGHYEKDEVLYPWHEDNETYSVVDNLGYDTKDKKQKIIGKISKKIYMEMTSDGLPEGGDSQAVLESRKLAEEIVDNKEEKYIYESPDGGKTIYKRAFGDYDNKILIKDWEDEKRKSNG
tara:strand:- start:363 stop:1103 length:741 start_codon:yes stop_codon:yes gene_type:complete